MSLEPSNLALSMATGAAAGVVGCFAVMRRMTLAADAMSHIALPGIGIAIVARIHPILGAATALLLGALLVWRLETKTGMATETVVGVVFSVALAIGGMITPGEELIEALFGGSGPATFLETAVGIFGSAAVAGLVLRDKDRLVLALVSPEIARAAGVDVARLNLRFLVLFALTIALGLRYSGALLIGSLIIIPAVTAKRVARNLTGMLVIAATVSTVSTTGGALAASLVRREAGPLVVVVAGACFVASLFFPNAGARVPRPARVLP
jgi:zinc transport system permease protein